jgi:hypothetical protein
MIERASGRKRLTAAVLALATTLMLAGLAALTSSTVHSEDRHDQPGFEVAAGLEQAFATVADTVNQSVVQVRSERVLTARIASPFEGTHSDGCCHQSGELRRSTR